MVFERAVVSWNVFPSGKIENGVGGTVVDVMWPIAYSNPL